MYIDYYLKFNSEQEADQLLFDLQTVTEDGITQTFKKPKYLSVDVIGKIYKESGNMISTPEGDMIPEMVEVPGWHVNVRHNVEMSELEIYRVFPSQLTRTWL